MCIIRIAEAMTAIVDLAYKSMSHSIRWQCDSKNQRSRNGKIRGVLLMKLLDWTATAHLANLGKLMHRAYIDMGKRGECEPRRMLYPRDSLWHVYSI